MDPKRSVIRRFICSITALVLAIAPIAANASLIRDAEIEHTLRSFTNPILLAADINPASIRILIVDDPSVNAFVAGGLNIFIHTGLIRAATKPEMLVGVIAHETGHISGAHLASLSERSSRSALGAAIGALIGVAAVIGGAGQAGAGVLAGTQSMAERRFIGDIRLNENAADQAALSYLDRVGYSASGMLEMFETLRKKEATVNIQPDPFLRSHPLNSERISAMQNHIAQNKIAGTGLPESFAIRHARMEAKLAGFMDTKEQVMRAYPPSDTSLPARYARSISAFKNHNLKDALEGINGLIKSNPDDGFFYDTKGQILYENGKLEEAAKAYEHATRLIPDSALILTDYARTLIAQNKPNLLPRAIDLLTRSIALDDSYAASWRELAVAYGKQGRLGFSYMALAEEASLSGDYKTALQHTARARRDVGNETTLMLKLDDIERDAKTQLKERRSGGFF